MSELAEALTQALKEYQINHPQTTPDMEHAFGYGFGKGMEFKQRKIKEREAEL